MGWKEKVHQDSGSLRYGQGDPFGLALGIREQSFSPLHHEVWFLQTLESHLLGAWELWNRSVLFELESNPELQQFWLNQYIVNSSHVNGRETIWGLLANATSHYQRSSISRGLEANQGKELAISGNDYSFSAEIWVPPVVWDENKLGKAYQAWWRYLMQPRIWVETEKRVGVPFMLELPEPAAGLPTAMILGGMPFELRFGWFYVPSEGIRKHPYTMRFFDYLGEEYQDVSDMVFKNSVYSLAMRDISLHFELREQLFRPPYYLLDLGCGPGLFGNFVDNRFSLDGVDISSRMADVARRSGKYGSVYNNSMLDLRGIRSGFYDAVVMLFVEPWLTDDDLRRGLREIRRVLKPNGVIWFNLHKPGPGRKEVIEDMIKTEWHRHPFSPIVRFFEQLVNDSDGNKVKLTYCMATPDRHYDGIFK